MISRTEGLGILKKWAVHRSPLIVISRGSSSPLDGPQVSEVNIELAGSVLRLVSVSGGGTDQWVGLDGVDFSSVRGASRLTLELKFPGDAILCLEQKIGG
jgi:hypothetical protein